MTFVSVCKSGDLQEGAMSLFRVGKKAVVLVWPAGGEIKAFRGRCPTKTYRWSRLKSTVRR